MYPEWPKSPADLIPLPRCDGPKLAAFDFKGPQHIEFLGVLGTGAHSTVFKVQIQDTEYALKLFWPLNYDDWTGPSRELWVNRKAMSIMYNYQEPFSAECRAYGRLSESGHTSLAVQCFGYVLLDEKHEETLMRKFSGLRNEDDIPIVVPGEEDFLRSHFLTKDGRQPPLRGIIKELGEPQETVKTTTVKSIRRRIVQLQQLGIMGLDMLEAQLVSGKFADFSTAVTMPNFLTCPELNPYLTPEQQLAIGFNTFVFSLSDYLTLDAMVRNENRKRTGGDPKAKGKLGHTAYTFPHPIDIFPKLTDASRQGSHLTLLKNLRNRGLKYTLVDPRGYVDRQRRAASQAKSARWPLDHRPPVWKYEQAEKTNDDLIKYREGIFSTVAWTYRDGYLFPMRKYSDRAMNPFDDKLASAR